MLSSIPSPSVNSLQIGPLSIHLYGVMIALGVLAAVWLARRRYQARGGNPDDISDIALWAVPAGLVGARVYHVLTDYQKTYCGPPTCAKSVFWDAFKVWDGGLGIPGAILGGAIVGIWYCRRHHIDILRTMDVAAPAIPLAQALGRWGNYFNQELFGRPTSLPWGLEIDPLHRPARYINSPTFHPTFLYESLWNLGVVGVLLWVDSKARLKPGKLFPAYIGLYFLGRMWVEEMRSDGAAMIGDFRFNFLLSLAMIVISAVWFWWGGAFAPPGEDLRPFPVQVTDEGGPQVPGSDVPVVGVDTGPGEQEGGGEVRP